VLKERDRVPDIGRRHRARARHGDDAKVALIEAFDALRAAAARDLDYKFMFPGPTGTNAVEARSSWRERSTGRTNVVVVHQRVPRHDARRARRDRQRRVNARRAGVPLGNVTRIPFAGTSAPDVDTLDALEALPRRCSSSGVDVTRGLHRRDGAGRGRHQRRERPSGCGVSRASRKARGILIVDDIQVGCGRTGAFFSFEEAGIVPDIVCLSKSLSGFGSAVCR
jgi:diaminobutyrate-2-oxoglutarate transaminase